MEGDIGSADPVTVAGVLDRVARIGPYFALDDLEQGAAPLEQLYATQGAPVLAAMVDDHARRLRTRERRVAGSILFQGLAARLWSPVLGCATEGVLLDLDPAVVHWWRRPQGPVGLHLPEPAGWLLPDPARRVDLVADAVVDRHLRPMVQALRRVVRVAEPLLWGNVASALMGAVLVIELAGGDHTARALARALLELAPLRGTAAPGPQFRRNSCCLYYRVPGGGFCGDCALHEIPT